MTKFQITGQVGEQQLGGGVSEQPFRQCKTGEQAISNTHARYAEALRNGRIWHAGNQAAQAVSVALATTYTGLVIYNPVGSGVIAVPLKTKYALSVAPAAISAIGLIVGFAATGGVTAETTPLTVQNGKIGNTSRGQVRAFSAATITTPTWLAQLVDGFTAAALPAPSAWVDVDGLVGLLPGAFVAIGALTAVTGLGSISWEEIPTPNGL